MLRLKTSHLQHGLCAFTCLSDLSNYWFSSFAIEALFSNLPKAFDTNLLVSILVLVSESVIDGNGDL